MTRTLWYAESEDGTGFRDDERGVDMSVADVRGVVMGGAMVKIVDRNTGQDCTSAILTQIIRHGEPGEGKNWAGGFREKLGEAVDGAGTVWKQASSQFDILSGKQLLSLVEERLEAQSRYNDILATKLDEALERLSTVEKALAELSRGMGR